MECGGKEDVRWFKLEDHEGCQLRVEGKQPLHIDVHRNTVADYAAARHDEDLKPRDRVFINIDCVHSGLGGDTGWFPNIHEEYQVKPGRYQYGVRLKLE